MARPLSMDLLVGDVVVWAQNQADIRAAAIVGSRARVDRPADEWSDLDLLVVVTEPQRYLRETTWLAHIAVPQLTFLEPTAVGGQIERRVLFEGGRDVDFSFVPTSMLAQLRQQGMPPEVALVFQRGVKLLLDKDGDLQALLGSVPSAPVQQPQPPSELVFTELVNDFLYHVIWCAKKLYRGELWVAALACNGYLKHQLLRMIEWHTQVRHGWHVDTWHSGRFLEQWAAPDVLTALPHTFAHYQVDDIQQALMASLGLFQRLATTVAQALNFTYPAQAHAYVLAWLQSGAAAQAPDS